MNEKERILDLVKQGIISSEEALVLLEDLGKKVSKEKLQSKSSSSRVEAEDFEKEDYKRLNDILETVASALTAFSADVDGKNQSIDALTEEIKEKEARKTELDTLENLENLNTDQQMERQRLAEELEILIAQKNTLEEERQTIEEEMIRLKKEVMEQKIKQVKEKVESTEWDKVAQDSAQYIGSSVGKFASQFSKAIQSVVKGVSNNVEWKSYQVNIPNLVSHTFHHEVVSPETQASIVDIKIAKGDIKIKTWEKPYIQILGDFKIYGALQEGQSPLEMLKERMIVDFTEEKMIFKLPNKRISCDITICLPNREYDYISVDTLYADIRMKDVVGKDFYLKCKHGDIFLKNLHGTMLETDVLNGDCRVIESVFRDGMIKGVNGDYSIDSQIDSLDCSTVNGDISIAVENPKTKRVQASTTNGDITFIISDIVGVEAKLKTALGSLSYDSTAFEAMHTHREKISKTAEIRRIFDEVPVQMIANCTTGDIVIQSKNCHNR